ncbi:MAG: hypothetical protein J6Y97_13145 [Prevotella sp.]|nr:hypothetical protein [Prevotella sp.]
MRPKPKQFLLPTIIFLAIVLVALAVRLWPRTVPFDQCSDLYKQYVAVEGINATYIKDYKVNDTVFVDVTLLEATDSMWHTLMTDFNIPTPDSDLQQFIDAGENLVVTKLVDKTHYSRPAAPCSSNCEIMAISYTTHSISVFHTVDAGERHAILYFNLDKSTNQ